MLFNLYIFMFFFTFSAGKIGIINNQFEEFIQWGRSRKMIIDGIDIIHQRNSYRKVVASKNMKEMDVLLFVPKASIITKEMALKSEIGRKMKEKMLGYYNHKQHMGEQSFMATYVMHEIKKGKDSEFYPYYYNLPSDMSEFPIFYDNDTIDFC